MASGHNNKICATWNILTQKRVNLHHQLTSIITESPPLTLNPASLTRACKIVWLVTKKLLISSSSTTKYLPWERMASTKIHSHNLHLRVERAMSKPISIPILIWRLCARRSRIGSLSKSRLIQLRRRNLNRLERTTYKLEFLTQILVSQS